MDSTKAILKRSWKLTRFYWSGAEIGERGEWLCPGLLDDFGEFPCWRCRIRSVLVRAKLLK